jgi:hypothetical protein
MLISVLIPLEFHRDQAVDSIGKWRREQTIDGALFEVIVIASHRSNPSDLEAVRALLGPEDRLVLTDAAHDVAQVAEAATYARADLLFFTESHVLPTPTVLAQCLELFAKHPEWAAFSCRTRGITPNRLARAEAHMYEADIQYGMTTHPWRKILDQCFVTRRAAYEAAAGFDATLGHFAEFLLAARYATLGLTIGYAPEIELSHYYLGDVATFREFTEDFIAGEMAYWARGRLARTENLMEPPIEWWSRGDRRRDLASHLLKVARRHCRACQGAGFTRSDLRAAYRRHAASAFTGASAIRGQARLELLLARLRLAWTRIFGPDVQLQNALQNYTSALARAGRLALGSKQSGTNVSDVLWTPYPDDVDRACGFHGGEVFAGVPFRWSEDVAVLEVSLPPGRHRLRLETLLTKLTTTEWVPAFYFNGRRIRDEKILRAEGHFEFEINRREGEGAMLGWVSGRQPAPGDPRHLGLPVSKLSLLPHREKSSGVRRLKAAQA